VVPFGNPQRGVFGVVSVGDDPASALIGGCEALYTALGGLDLKPLAHPAPAGMGPAALVYSLKTPTAGAGRLACAKRRDGRLLGVAVALVGTDPAVAESAADKSLDEVGAGLSLP